MELDILRMGYYAANAYIHAILAQVHKFVWIAPKVKETPTFIKVIVFQHAQMDTILKIRYVLNAINLVQHVHNNHLAQAAQLRKF